MGFGRCSQRSAARYLADPSSLRRFGQLRARFRRFRAGNHFSNRSHRRSLALECAGALEVGVDRFREKLGISRQSQRTRSRRSVSICRVREQIKRQLEDHGGSLGSALPSDGCSARRSDLWRHTFHGANRPTSYRRKAAFQVHDGSGNAACFREVPKLAKANNRREDWRVDGGRHGSGCRHHRSLR